jgi:hypothetical protein
VTKRALDVAIVAVSVAIVAVLTWSYVRSPRSTSPTASPPPQGDESAAGGAPPARPDTPSALPKTEPVPSPPVARTAETTSVAVPKPPLDAPSRVPPAIRPVDSDCVPSAKDLKAMMADARSTYPDDNGFILGLDTIVGVDSQDAANLLLSVAHHDESISVFVAFPYRTYRLSLLNALRKRDPLEEVSIPRLATVVVSPSQITAPDIVKVIVERDGRVAVPVVNGLTVQPFKTRMGAEKMLHAGQIGFQCSVFAPGADVVVTAIPDVGANLVKRFTSTDLAKLK